MKWYRDNKARAAATSRKRKYGITQEQYDALFETQGFKCALCGTDYPQSKNPWHLDHCHTTGAVRGILCHHCNVGLGGFKDSTDVMQKAIAYLKGDNAQIIV